MREEKKLVPKRRFKEYQNTNAWEQRRFDSVFDRISNNTLSRADLNYDDGKIKSVHYGDILVKYGAVTDCGKDVIPFITGAEVSDYQSQLLQDGDVLIADAAEDETVGKATEIAGITGIPVVSGLHTIACRPKVKMQPNYLGYYMNSPSYHQQLLPLMQGIKVLSISRTNLAKTTICYPTSEMEQSQIGTFFTKLDHLITLHQRKLEKAKALKSAYLSEMFPAEGEYEPKRRFAGFTDAWEQRKLGEVVQIKDSARVPNELWAKSGVRYLRSSDLENNGRDGALFISIGAYEDYKSKTGAPERGDVLFNSGGNIGLSLLKTDDTPVYVQGGAILYARTSQSNDVDGGYLSVYFSTHRMAKYIDISSAGGTIKHFTLKPANAAPFIFPNVIEQRKISELFTELDHLITLHQRKLEKLRSIKKAYLNEMFV